MSTGANIAQLFEAVGGTFPDGFAAFRKRAQRVRAIIFDWDGVFNDGLKSKSTPSPFGEADSMGTNMARFGLFRHGQDTNPIAAIITGENNPAAVQFAVREHFHAIYRGIPDKRLALKHLCQAHNLSPEQVCFVFDDINDLGLAGQAGLRIQVRRAASPLLTQFIADRRLADYVTGAASGRGAVREACELLLGALDQFEPVIEARVEYNEEYSRYFAGRQAVATESYTADESGHPVSA